MRYAALAFLSFAGYLLGQDDSPAKLAVAPEPYGTTGALLGSVSYPSLNAYSTGIVGGEFQLPEPGTPLLMIAGLAALAGGRWHR